MRLFYVRLVVLMLMVNQLGKGEKPFNGFVMGEEIEAMKWKKWTCKGRRWTRLWAQDEKITQCGPSAGARKLQEHVYCDYFKTQGHNMER